MAEPLLIIGKGMAATRLVEELSKSSLGRYAIAVVGDEPRRAYNRVLLSSVLARDVGDDEIDLKDADWWRARGVTTLYGQAATEVDFASRAVTLADGRKLGFAKLVFATGSQAVRLPLPGADLQGVLTFRTMEDVARIRCGARPGARAIVIGGGLLGLEAAYGLAKAGAQVAVIHLMDRLMERQLDAVAAGMLKDELARRGVTTYLGAATERIVGEGEVEGLLLKDGALIEAEMVVMAVGIRPNTGLAKAGGVKVNRGILVDDGMETDLPGVYALGECAEHRGVVYGLVEPAYEQAATLARRLGGREAAYAGSLLSTNLKVSGVKLFSAGDFLGEEGAQIVTLRDDASGVYKKFVIAPGPQGSSLKGCVLYGETDDGPWYFDFIRSGAPIDAMRDELAFGRAVAERAQAA